MPTAREPAVPAPSRRAPTPRRRLAERADIVAPRLLGALLTHTTDEGPVTVRLTEVEAYLGPGDPGSHAYRGLTARTAPMFGPPGHLYVYFTYGMHWCANLVTGPDGQAGGVLLRAGEVMDGVGLARSRRPAARSDRDLARGPARLATALGLDGAHQGERVSLPGEEPLRVNLRMRSRSVARARIAVGPRVGVAGPGGDGERFPLRFWLRDDPTVSVYRPGRSS